ncbi:phospholipase D-like domain-containing protein [Propionibacterium sp.]|uniref:phospholipase D-like domain-containing protein n=1 Tax=Propionibacterium sp. TaxID=1977903 RepID=UPI0039ED85B2
MPNNADRRTVGMLKRQLDSGKVQVKVYTRQPLHGKTYILHRKDISNPITGYVGSSNLTGPGLRSNTELNVDVQDNDASTHLDAWFTRHWNDDFCWPITSDVIELIEDSWVGSHTPWQVFMKVCYDLSRDVRDGQTAYSIPSQIAGELMDFQATAVRTLARRVVARGGTMLGDVVGLGKTITAIAVACMLYEEHGMRPLVICPKNLAGMWGSYLADYDLAGRVVPYSMADKILPDLRRYEFVIVDESHTLRNNQRKDYVAIHDYIHTNDSKVLALTATPYNKEYRDVANQVGLWVGEDDDLGISPDVALARDPDLTGKLDGKITTLAAFRCSEEPADWKRLMSENLVRRTRSFVQANYAQDGGMAGSSSRFPMAAGSCSRPAQPSLSITRSATTTQPALWQATPLWTRSNNSSCPAMTSPATSDPGLDAMTRKSPGSRAWSVAMDMWPVLPELLSTSVSLRADGPSFSLCAATLPATGLSPTLSSTTSMCRSAA